jgi:hypothetical protein
VEIRCTQCGASLSVAADVRLLQCQFCGTALVVAGEGTLFHEVMLPTVAEEVAKPDTLASLQVVVSERSRRLAALPFEWVGDQLRCAVTGVKVKAELG